MNQTIYQGSHAVYLINARARGHIASISAYVNEDVPTITNYWTKLCDLPAAYEPIEPFYIMAVDNQVKVYVGSNDIQAMKATASATSTAVVFQTSYIRKH